MSTTTHSNSILRSKTAKYLWSHTSILTLLLACSVFINLLLARKVSQLQQFIFEVSSEGRLEIDSRVPPIEARDVDGNPVFINYTGSERPTVLYVFTPQCDWCTRNLANVRTIANHAGERYRFVGLSLSSDQLREYISRNNIDYPVYTELPDSVRSAYMLGGTPQTIIVSAEGRVIKNWMGAYSHGLRQDVEEYFRVRLPGTSD